VRCPDCHALNPDTAQWCTQCYASLRTPEPEPERVPERVPEPGDVQTGEPAQIVRRGHATFRKTGQALEWQCGRCDGFNPIELQHCPTCGHSFAGTVRGPEEQVVPQVGENVALIASAVLPGAGHYLAGRTATGVARAAVYVLFAVGGWVLLREASSSGQSALPALPLLLGALVVWIGSAYDAVLAARGVQRQVLEGRAFFWLVVGVLGLLMATFVIAALSVSPADGPERGGLRALR